MAVYPCDFDRRRYPLPQQSMYFTLVQGTSADSYAVRLCPMHFKNIWEGVKLHMAELDDGSSWSDDCEHCHAPRAVGMYVKVYPHNQELTHYVVDLCADWAGKLCQEGGIYKGSLLKSRSGGSNGI